MKWTVGSDGILTCFKCCKLYVINCGELYLFYCSPRQADMRKIVKHNVVYFLFNMIMSYENRSAR
jgi:hypothetical protein